MWQASLWNVDKAVLDLASTAPSYGGDSHWRHPMTAINVSTDFTRFPSGRFKKNGSTSGEAFREQFLEKPISEGQKVVILLDGTVGYGSSFLEEAFGGLVRKLKLSADKVLSL